MRNNKPKFGISIMPNSEFLAAALPLFQEELIEIIEWSFDTVKDVTHQPSWLPLMLKEYGENNKLLGHGVYYPLLDAKWDSRQENWLERVKQEISLYNYNQISEHFGFMSSKNAHNGYPLPIHLSNDVLQIGIDRLKRLQDTVKLDVGIENLALAANPSDIMEHGEFLFKLVSPVNGFIILDLHNIYCQSENFGIDMMTIIKSYPLSLAKEIHISGGSWDNDPTLTRKIRRDTHDGRVPDKIFDILPEILKLCSTLQYIIFEKVDNSFQTLKDGIEFRADFKKVKTIINDTYFNTEPRKWKQNIETLDIPLTDLNLFKKQEELRQNIKLGNYKTNSKWDKDMWKTATKLYKKWNN